MILLNYLDKIIYDPSTNAQDHSELNRTMNLKFKNITISGGVSTGKNTLLDNLKPHLEPQGWKFTSGGQILRDFAKRICPAFSQLG